MASVDLDYFDAPGLEASHSAEDVRQNRTLSPAEALELSDSTWYSVLSRRSRWMDLIGDYAGNERFVLDGESLLQEILNDRLLALGRSGDPSFQILHAKHSLEKILENLRLRSPEFDVVFWEESRHLTLKTGASHYEVSSRVLAHTLLFQHLSQLDVAVYVFKDINDAAWVQYLRLKRPMFILMNDGGLAETKDVDKYESSRILLQRVFLFRIITSGISVALFSTSEQRDTKILAFVLEAHLNLNAAQLFPEQFWKAHARVRQDLDARDTSYPLLHPTTLSVSEAPMDLDGLVTHLCRAQKTMHFTLLQVFISHLFILKTVSVRERALPLASLNPGLLSLLVEDFLPGVFSSLAILTSEHKCPLDVDTRLFVYLLHVICLHPDSSLEDIVGANTFERTERVLRNLGLDSINIGAFAEPFPPPVQALGSVQPAAPPAYSVLPFSNEVFDEQLESVHVRVANEPSTQTLPRGRLEFGEGTVFADTRHWHNKKALLPKHLGGENPKAKDEWARNKQLKRDQRFMAQMQKQATSLTGALGVPFDRQTIAPVGVSPLKGKDIKSDTAKKANSKKMEKTVSHSSKKPAVETKAAQIRKQNDQRMRQKETDESTKWWKERLRDLDGISNVLLRVTKTEDLFRNPRCKGGWLSFEVRMYRMHLEFVRWIEDTQRESAESRDTYSVSIMRMVRHFYGRKCISKVLLECLTMVLTVLGFSRYLHTLSVLQADESLDRPMSFRFIQLTEGKSQTPTHKFMTITEDPVLWQLRLFGEFMDRSMDSQPDSRVCFEPDGWQREVLDCIDANKSLLVVAPTSAGKTFISFYAMEQTLRGSDDGILVYVAPTKALVNQIAAEISARFSKDVAGRSCWAVHTRDYRIHDPQKCQILVTVPEMLAIMLMSPALARNWTPRIKRIILDEIHSIGQQEGGAVWEQILLLAPCPIIGLSATIGHPEIFNSWLETVQTAHGFDLVFIHHPHRYSHLRKFIYLLPTNPSKFAGLAVHKASDRMRFLHPMSMLAFGAPTLPSDLSMEAQDTLTLYEAMVLTKESIPTDLHSLAPSKFFSKRGFLKQKDVLEYEAALKTVINDLIAAPDSRDASSAFQKIVQTLKDTVILRKTEEQLNSTPSPTQFVEGLIPLLADLHSQKDLPAVFFTFDRAHIELMAKTVLKTLKGAESKWRETSPEFKRKLEEWQNWRRQMATLKAVAEKAKKWTKDEMAREFADAPRASSFDPREPSEGFSFADIHKYSKEEIQEDLSDLQWTSVPDWLKAALRRGIGVHHSGMNKAYRNLVERLFRLGYLRVVFATGTLALGINAPAKTAVFCGDSPFLTSLMFRQCAGRAGRRGYDLLGKVVFYGIPMDRVQRLILSKLPVLTGNFPLSSTLCLRLLNLLHGSRNAPVAVEAFRSILRLPHISFGSDTGRDQLLHHVRFSIEYLRRSGLLDSSGQPMNLFGIAAHLYYTEPSNFALVALMRAGVLHDICNQSRFINAKAQFVLLMAYLFGRRYVPSSYSKESILLAVRSKYPSQIILPPLPEKARQALLEHNNEVLRIFSGYAALYCSQHAEVLGPDDSLPLSGIKPNSAVVPDTEVSIFHDSLREAALPVTTRSPFVANSGHSDDFKTVEELSQTCRRGLNLNEHAIPSLHHIVADPNQDKDTSPLNAYIVDFFNHGQVDSLVFANGIRRGDVWYLLQDFSLTLMTVRTTLEHLLTKASSEARVALEDSEGIDSGYFSADMTEIDDGETEITPASTFKRPARVSDKDWRVYEVVDNVFKEFDEQFRKMWA